MPKSAKVKTDKDYIVVEDLPIDQKEVFYDWLTGVVTPVVIEEEIKRQKWVMCAYTYDYSFWYDSWIDDKVADKDQTVNDILNTEL